MPPETLYLILLLVISGYLIMNSVDYGLTTVASKSTGSFTSGVQTWTQILIGIISGMSLAYLVTAGAAIHE